MKNSTNSTRTIEFLVGILATATILIGIALYAWDEPTRLREAQAMQLEVDLNEASTLFAQNCAVCHGAVGEGIGATPALDNPPLRDIDEEAVAKIIARGLFGSAMTAWSLEDGGPLSEYQVSQMVDLIKFGDWQAVQERVVNLGLTPLIPFVTEADPLILESVANLPGGETLVAGISLYAEQCVACHGADGLGTTLAPALNDPAIGDRNPPDLDRIIRLGVAGTLMAGWEKVLDGGEIASLLELISRWDEVPGGAIPAPDQPILVTAESLALGSELYAASCANCHGPEGQGSQRASSLNVRAYLEETPDSALQQIITLGVPETAMPAWGDRLNEAQIQAIVGFIRSWEPTAPEVAQPVRVRGPWWRGGAAAGGALQLPSGGEIPATSAGTPDSVQPSDTVTQHQPSTAGQHSPMMTPELPWYQKLDEGAIALVIGVVLLSLWMILTGLHGLRRLARQAR
jgi:mono/diheme cytochrome c family protein